MKVTSNLSFLLCISSVVMPVTDARANGFDLKRSAVAMKRSIQRQDVFDFAAQQQLHRGLKSPVTERSINVHQQPRSLQTTDAELQLALCESAIEIYLGPDSGCSCDEDFEIDLSSECQKFISECSPCDTIQDQQTCFTVDEEASTAASTADLKAACFTYVSGPFDNTICSATNYADGTCTVTIDGAECNSCAFCGETDGTGATEGNYDIDCSNVIEGETWNLCTDDVPETSPFINVANNDRFLDDVECGLGDSEVSEGSGGFCPSFHGLSVMVSLIVVTTLW
jgi:hypothetical protein